MTPFELVEPPTFAEAAALLDAPDARPVAGGTAVMLMMKLGVLRPMRLVSLRAAGARGAGIAMGDDGGLRIGAMTTLSALEKSREVAAAAPVVTRALRRLSNVRVRNVATVGGHLAHGDPHMDLPPVLIALGAQVDISGPSGERTLPLEALYRGYLETALARNELISRVTVAPQGARRAAYLKCTTRAVDDWPALGIAAVLEMDGGAVRNARLLLSAATDVPTRLAAAEKELNGAPVDERALGRATEAAVAEANVISDAHGSAVYKRELLRTYLARAVRAALAQDDGRQ